MNLYPSGIAGNTVVLERTDDPVLRFVVCSDIHMDDTAQCAQYGRLEKLFRHSYDYAESQPYDSIDAFVFAGDIITDGKKVQADLVNEIVANEMKPGTPLMCVYDNHDISNNNTIAGCEEWFGVPSSYSDERLIYYIEKPSNRSSFGYTNARYKTADTPVWPQGAQADLSDITSNGATVTFPQALDGEEIHHYSLVVKKRGVRVGAYKFWSEFYFEPIPPTMSWALDGLKPDTEYTVEITGFDTYLKQTKAPLKASFRTAAE